MNSAPGPTEFPLCAADDATFWPWKKWPEFAAYPQKEAAVVIIPLAGMADWSPEIPLDIEERILLRVLNEAVRSLAPAPWLLCLPPLRFVLGPDPRCAFPIDPPAAHALLAEVVGSVAAAGFRRIGFFNSSPYNEELCGAAARDLRLEKNLEMFCVHLSALGVVFAEGFVPPAESKLAEAAARLAAGLKELGP